MGLRPAKCYRKLERPYTRQSRKKLKKSYAKGVPQSKIRKFEAGNPKKPYSMKLYLIAANAVQIRHNALEAARIALNKNLDKSMGKENYFFRILVYPHHIMRENVLATGAGADRFQTGMRLSFGKPIGTAARVSKNQKIIEVRVDKNREKPARKALDIAGKKFPTPCRIVSEVAEVEKTD
jgi:large subunit ribosomal protein L10e